MTATTVDQLVSDYLGRLEAAAAELPVARRVELLAEIHEHITAARAEGVASDEVTTRTMLDHLGDPEDIVAAAKSELGDEPPNALPPRPPVVLEKRSGTGLELGAVLLLTAGSFIPLIGWAVGVVLLWASPRWRTREKLLGTLLVPTGPGGLFYFSFFLAWTPGQVCESTLTPGGEVIESCSGTYIPPWIALPVITLGLIAPFIVAGVLYSRARRRADAEPPVQRSARTFVPTGSPWGGAEIAAVALLASSVLIFVIGPFILAATATGLVFVWASTRWTRHEKWIATAIALAPLAATALVVLALRGLG